MNYAIDLTPYVLVRICNESVEHLLLGAESGASLAQHLTACQQAQDAFDADRSLLVNALFDYMRTCTDARQQQQIQEVRRCLFNKRALKRKDVEMVGTYLPDSLATRLAACYATEQALAEQRQAFAQQHTAVLAATRQQLNQRYASELFQQGLLLSSLTLQANSRRLISADPASLRKDDLQVENGLLRYYTRMSTKTSPYSTFSSVQFAKLTDRVGSGKVAWQPSLRQLRSVVRPNQAVLSRLADTAPTNTATVSLNATLRRQNDAFQYVVSVGNVEQFCRVPVSPVLTFMAEFLREEVDFSELVTQLGQRFAAEPATAETYVRKLVSLGFLETAGAVDDEIQAEIGHLQQASAAFQQSHCAVERRQVLLGTWAGVREQLPPTPVPDRLSPETLWFEDSVVTGDTPLLDRDVLSPFVDSLESLCRTLETVTCLPDSPALCFFNQTYGPTETVPLTDFFEAYQRAITDRPAWLIAAEEQVAVVHPDYRTAWTTALAQLKRDATGVVHLSTADLANVIGHQPTAPTQKRSRSAFLQIYREQNQHVAVLNGIIQGYGKMFSRFLGSASPAIGASIRVANEQHSPPGEWWAENHDATTHNANHHNGLMPFSVVVPGGARLPHTQGLSIGQLAVRLNPADTQELILIDQQTGVRVRTFDLGFQASGGRSPLFRLLAQLEPVASPPLGSLLGPVWKQHERPAPNDADVREKPRIMVDNQVVIQRRQWSVPVKRWYQDSDTDAEFFARVHQHRTAVGLPDEVFVHLQGRTESDKDDYKPQYIHFQHPVLVHLLRRLLRKAGDSIRVVEVNPPTSAGWQTDGRKHVSEFVANWYSTPDQQ